VIYWRNDQIDKAALEFQQELTRHPDDPVANCTLGRILRQRNEPAQAQPLLEAAVRVNPSYRDALVALGQVRMSLGDTQGAIDALKHAVALNPNDAEAHYILGSALNLAGRPEQGLQQRVLSEKIRERERRQHNAVQAKP
jgi:protein O-GlcNAc transferase